VEGPLTRTPPCSTPVPFTRLEDGLLGLALAKTPSGAARVLTDPATRFTFTVRPYAAPPADAPPLDGDLGKSQGVRLPLRHDATQNDCMASCATDAGRVQRIGTLA
jgi:hypothetical protein